MARERELRDALLELRDNMSELTALINEMRAFKVGINPELLKKIHGLNIQSSTILSLIAENFCEKCGAIPKWQRSAQFAGDFKFCDKCARKQPDFGVKDGSFVWKRI